MSARLCVVLGSVLQTAQSGGKEKMMWNLPAATHKPRGPSSVFPKRRKFIRRARVPDRVLTTPRNHALRSADSAEAGRQTSTARQPRTAGCADGLQARSDGPAAAAQEQEDSNAERASKEMKGEGRADVREEQSDMTELSIATGEFGETREAKGRKRMGQGCGAPGLVVELGGRGADARVARRQAAKDEFGVAQWSETRHKAGAPAETWLVVRKEARHAVIDGTHRHAVLHLRVLIRVTVDVKALIFVKGTLRTYLPFEVIAGTLLDLWK
ncbi:hypothetical protein DFH09DRAFT_1080132 [Mycena vulgaris]|nr:hypothetical protein DFH09DRAFT_1080132 [Mycena vulgaris]